jgi:hypothetical protein
MYKLVLFMAIAVSAALSACGGQEPAQMADVEIAEPPAPQPARLPIGEITKADLPDLMAAIYKDGAPDNVWDLGVVVMGERAVLLTGADSAEACTDCTGSLSLFYLVRMEAGFLLQEEYRDFHPSGSGGNFNREIELTRFGGRDGRAAYAGFTDVNGWAECDARTLTVYILTEAGPRKALEAPFGVDKGSGSVDAMIVDPEPFQAEFAIAYESSRDDFVAPYMFVNQMLRPSFPTPSWTRAAC